MNRVVTTVASLVALLSLACSDVTAPPAMGNPSDNPSPSQSGMLILESITLNQGNQTPSGSIGIVAGRAGILRVLVRAQEENTLTRFVRVRLTSGTQLIRDTILSRAQPGVPLDPSFADFNSTWNLRLADSDIVPGLTVEAMVDAESAVPDPARAARMVRKLNPVDLPPIRIVFVPVYSTVQGTTGRISTGNVDAMLVAARKWMPSNGIEPSIHATHTTNLDLSVSDNWSRLLAELQALRTIDGATDEYYHGIVGDFAGIPHGGRAYRPTSPTSASRTGVSYDRMPVAPETIAHELGHNMGRMHSPCGDPDGADPGFPYTGATLGSPSYDIFAGQFRSAETSRDFMSYCHPRQPSDYTYQAILSWRIQGAGTHANFQIAPGAGSTPRDGLLLTGHMSARGVTLNPAVVMKARASLPDVSGPNEIVAMAADGSEVFRMRFAATAVEDTDEEAFTFFMPVASTDLARIQRIELRTPRGNAVSNR